MFGRFLDGLKSRGVTLATFGDADLDAFLGRASGRFKTGTTTGLRYLKLIDRVCRHLVFIGLRTSNPAALRLVGAEWPDTEPTPLYLPPDADARLEAWVNERRDVDLLDMRNRAVVALFLGCGVTVAELQRANVVSLRAQLPHPYSRVELAAGAESESGPPVGAKSRERTIKIDTFAVDVLKAWGDSRTKDKVPGAPLFPGGRVPRLPPRTLDRIVKEALMATDFVGPGMSPRVLRNTYARRQLLGGRTNAEVTASLGLASERTVTRIRATIGRGSGGRGM